MTVRISIIRLSCAIVVLGLSHACYYQYYQEPPADFAYRYCQVGCGTDVNPDSEGYSACCVPVSSGAIIPATCSVMASSAKEKGTSCSWSAVATDDMPSSFEQAPPRTTAAPIASACVTTWVTETAAPSCGSAQAAIASSSPSVTIPGVSEVNAVPSSSVESVITSPPGVSATTAPTSLSSSASIESAISSAPPVEYSSSSFTAVESVSSAPSVESAITSPTSSSTSSSPSVPASPDASVTSTSPDCCCDEDVRSGSLPPRLGKRGPDGSCPCPSHSASQSAPQTANTCSCDIRSGSLREERRLLRSNKRTYEPAMTCPCNIADVTATSAVPCESDVRSGSVRERDLETRGGEACGAAVGAGEYGAVSGAPVISVPGAGTSDDISAFERKKRALAPDGFVPETGPSATTAVAEAGSNSGSISASSSSDASTASLINSLPTSSTAEPIIPGAADPTPSPVASSCTTTMTTTITPACSATDQPTVSVASSVAASSETSATPSLDEDDGAEWEDCDEDEDADAGGDRSGSLPT